MYKPKNLIIEEVPDEIMRDCLYSLLESDIPIYYTHHKRAVPNAINVYDYDTVKIFVVPHKEQEQYTDKRIIDLYDDLSQNLRDFAEELQRLPPDKAEQFLRDTLTQYDAKETAAYLKESLENGLLFNYAEIVTKDEYYDRHGYIETYSFYLKGELKSYGITVEHKDDCYCLLYDGENYAEALDYFAENMHDEDIKFYRKFRAQQNQM